MTLCTSTISKMAFSRFLHPSFRLLQHITIVNGQHVQYHESKRAICAFAARWASSKVNKPVVDPTEYDSPRELYEARINANELRRDFIQMTIITELEKLNSELIAYEPNINNPRFLSKVFGSGNKSKDVVGPQGLYLYGTVGCGKTMLMDLFYHTMHIEKKQRTHFHEFMLDIHRRIHIQKARLPRSTGKGQSFDPIPPVAKDIAEETWLLCFDEFQVTDIADAMILKRLFKYMWKNGVVVVATSNRHPDDLYQRGLQRVHFLPFIPILKKHCKLLPLDSVVDYRMIAMPADQKVYFITPEDGLNETKASLDAIFKDMIVNEKGETGPRILTVLARQVTFEKTCGRVIDVTFNDICMRPLGAVDYLHICKEFDTMILRDIPRMNLDNKVEARRFITLIDTIYDNRVRLVCSAEAPANWLFVTDQESEYQKHFARVLYGDLDINVGDENETASIFTGEEEKFAFARVVSRLTEMQSVEYWTEREELIKKRHKTDERRRAKAALRGRTQGTGGS